MNKGSDFLFQFSTLRSVLSGIKLNAIQCDYIFVQFI